MHPMMKYQMAKERIEDLNREAGRMRAPKSEDSHRVGRHPRTKRLPRLIRIRPKTAR